ncbi:hypothetical protein [Pseudoflavitalea rhizosphaerae]|uniref:hypothetical protein n=1 Tax=Pseudoflavitalea rhizosphaerae TaxID=1884793 RepID=UPI000F8E4CAD|nr:hypothetical protein [Pseudoflavitalea rhizosphaerae]
MKFPVIIGLALLSFSTTKAQNTFPATGNVGIGTTTPNRLLHVAGVARLANLAVIQQGTGSNPEITSDGNSVIRIKGQRGTIIGKLNALHSYQTEAIALSNGDNKTNIVSVYNNSDVSVMTITNTGNIGIGITAPTEKLCVNGNIFTKKVKVTATGWPDYVFHPSYKLMPLDQLERFIKANRHLPEIVPAKEVEENGLDLGDNQAALLKKIEELTLYLIDLKKTVDEQNLRIKTLEAKKN